MQYLLLIYSDEKLEAKYAEEDFNKWMTYTEEIKNAGVYLGGEALKPVATATTVRQNGNSTLTIDGPFAETKEQLGGFYFIDVPGMDQALEWAKKMPHISRGGSVEVRPVMKFD